MPSILLYITFLKRLLTIRFWFLYVAIVVSTLFLVLSGLDWWYLGVVLALVPQWILFFSDSLGYFIPVFLPLILCTLGYFLQNKLYSIYAQAIVYATILAFSISTTLKIFTGRTSPPHSHKGEELVRIDSSRDFNFGFMQEQILGGWPSSHTTVAFAIAVTLLFMLPVRWYYKACIMFIALFIGIGVSFGWHWLSEFVAGALLGTAIGIVVGEYFKTKMEVTVC